jgi:hypothetical protein
LRTADYIRPVARPCSFPSTSVAVSCLLTASARDTAHPERFVRQIPPPPALPTAVSINKPEDNEVPPQ